jgi:predicted negative regulator of RcsB-dependent stress response
VRNLAKAIRKKRRVTVKEMKFKNDPMIRLYERTQEWLQESGRPVLLVAGAIVGLVVLYTIGYYFSSYRQSKAAAALSSALEKFNAPVTDTAPVNPTAKTYTDEKVKWQEAAEAFDRVASDYSGYYGVIGRYYAGAAYLHFDQAKAIDILQKVADKNSPPTSDLARLALADYYSNNGEYDKALPFYEALRTSNFAPKQIVLLGLGRVYEKSGNSENAAEAYFQVAAADRSSTAGSEAEKRLMAIAPQKVKDLPAPNSPD